MWRAQLIGNQESLIMRYKICQTLIKELKGKLHRDLNGQCIPVNLRAYVATTINS